MKATRMIAMVLSILTGVITAIFTVVYFLMALTSKLVADNPATTMSAFGIMNIVFLIWFGIAAILSFADFALLKMDNRGSILVVFGVITILWLWIILPIGILMCVYYSQAKKAAREKQTPQVETPQPVTYLYCAKCGNLIYSGDRFCQKCGTAIRK